MNDKPLMYQNKEKKVFNNNKKVFYSYKDNNVLVSTNNIRNKILSIINSNDFIYRKKVYINIDNNILEKKIVSLIGNNILTIDNELIPIDKIKDIYK